MATDNGDMTEGPPQEVIDEEGSVDKALKKRIIKARERVDETELALYRDAAIEPDINLGRVEKIHIYATTVKQFLRRIEPLLRVKDVPNNTEYYKEVEIGEVDLVPPDTDGYQFSLIGHSDRSDKELRRMLGLPRGVDLPEKRTVTFQGLQRIIEEDPILQYRWEVCVQKSGARRNWDYIYPAVQRPVPKNIYEDAVRRADMFLQNAGIGLDTDTKGTEIIKNFDMSGEKPTADYGVGDYNGNPDI